jgi:hypothetical protein
MVRFPLPRPTLYKRQAFNLSSQNAEHKQIPFIHILLQIFESPPQYSCPLDHNHLCSSPSSFSKLDQPGPCPLTPTPRLKPLGNVSRRAKRFQEWKSIKGEVKRLYVGEDKSLQVTMQEVERKRKFEFTSRYSPLHPAPTLPTCHLHYPSECILKLL